MIFACFELWLVCRALVGDVMKILFERVGADAVEKLAQFCFTWLESQEERLRRASAQVP